MGFRHALLLCVTCTVIDVSTALISWVQAWLICSKLFAVFYVFLCVYSIYRFIMYIWYRNMHHCLASLCRTYTHYIQVCNKQFILLSSVDLLGHIYTAFVEMVLFEHFFYLNIFSVIFLQEAKFIKLHYWPLTFGFWQVSGRCLCTMRGSTSVEVPSTSKYSIPMLSEFLDWKEELWGWDSISQVFIVKCTQSSNDTWTSTLQGAVSLGRVVQRWQTV